MQEDLSARDLVALVQRVFVPRREDRRLALLVDLPDGRVADNPAWRERREMAAGWAERLGSRAGDVGLEEVRVVLYRNVRANNADLPDHAHLFSGRDLPATAEALEAGASAGSGRGSEPAAAHSLEEVFGRFPLIVAPTEFSATAPLKIAARKHAFRAATMPGFSPAMIPALRLDYGVIARRVEQVKTILDRARLCEITFHVAGGGHHELALDLRHRTAHASGGLLSEPGTAGNLPSGESYIVPYEGEIAGVPSQTRGEIPVQFGSDIVIYRIEDNVAREILSHNESSELEARKLSEEPAYGNIAELGLGVLSDFGLQPTGSLLLDEKLGLHVAFGRSEHFGGQVGPDRFSSPERVVHIDRVYIPAIQPDVAVSRARLMMEDGSFLELMSDGRYVIDLDG